MYKQICRTTNNALPLSPANTVHYLVATRAINSIVATIRKSCVIDYYLVMYHR